MRFPAFNPQAKILGIAFAATMALAGLSGCSTESDGGGGDGKLIQLTYPKGGESVKEGDSLYVTWKVESKNIEQFTGVDPMISLDDGKTWNNMKIGSIPPPKPGEPSPSWGRWGWKVDSINVAGAKKSVVTTQARIRVEEYSTAEPTKISTPSAVFTIQAK